MKPTDAAYLAGIIDGDGCISAFIGHSGVNINQRHARVTVEMTDPNIMQYLQSIAGCGHLGTHKPRGNRKNTFYIVWHGKTAIPVLKAVIPYLRVKRPQAEAFMEFVAVMKEGRQYIGGNGRKDRVYPPHIVARFDEILAKFRLLNHVGLSSE